MATTIKTTFQLRRGNAEVWAKNNPVLAAGEPGFELDTGKLKIGNGSDAYNNLPYVGIVEAANPSFVPVVWNAENNSVTSSYTYNQVRELVDKGKDVVVKAEMSNPNTTFYLYLVSDMGTAFTFYSGVSLGEGARRIVLLWDEASIRGYQEKVVTEDDYSNNVPLQASTTPSAGVSTFVSRADHVHPAETEPITDTVLEAMWNDPNPTHFLTFSSPEPFTLSVNNATKNWDGTLEYSTDKYTWTEWNGTTTLNSADNKLYVRGTGNSVISGGYGKGWKLSGTAISCFGNIETLLDWQTVVQGTHPPMVSNCYEHMFFDCTSLTTPPELPATTLTQKCYRYMFSQCTSLTTPPELPATELADFCYENMFSDCTSLTTVPRLPATKLKFRCYYYMFSDCTSLTTPPELPATKLADSCYLGMFANCTSLTTPPELPVINLASNCYAYMLRGCTSLTTAPSLPATTLADNCYEYMFYDCTSLTTVPRLSATNLQRYCYANMFGSCTKIKFSATQTDEYTQEYRIPTSGTGSTGMGSLANMFKFTGGTFTDTPTINTTYYLHKDNSIVPAT